MAVLKTTSPVVSPAAPKERPSKTRPSSRARVARGLFVLTIREHNTGLGVAPPSGRLHVIREGTQWQRRRFSPCEANRRVVKSRFSLPSLLCPAVLSVPPVPRPRPPLSAT